MSYTAPLKVRYGTAVEPWHSLSPWYHADTPLPLRRDYTKAPRRVPIRWVSLGQVDVGTAAPFLGIAAGLAALAALGGSMRRNRRRRR